MGNRGDKEKGRLIFDLINIFDDDDEKKLSNCLMYFLNGKICVKNYE